MLFRHSRFFHPRHPDCTFLRSAGIIGFMDQLAQHARELFDINLAPAHMEALRIYERELHAWNQNTNLTAIRAPEQVRTKHFLDSLSCMSVMRGTEMERVIDALLQHYTVT